MSKEVGKQNSKRHHTLFLCSLVKKYFGEAVCAPSPAVPGGNCLPVLPLSYASASLCIDLSV